jgi:Zn-finger nucleic acid-binding protein
MKPCPRCGASLSETALGGISVDGCRGCGGTWFEHVELTVLARANPDRLGELEDRFQPSPADRRRQQQMSCPTCAVGLFEFEFKHAPGIRLDGCPRCKGIWVDDGELQAIQARLQREAPSGAPRPAPAPAASSPGAVRQRARQALSILSRVACADCRQPNPEASMFCWACGSSLKGGKQLLCPHCDQRLTRESGLGVSYDACSHCGGLWLDQGELPRLLKHSPEEIERLEQQLSAKTGDAVVVPETETALVCPACSVPIQTRQYAIDTGIYIDRCDQCRGIWVDSGELTRIARVLQPQE